MTKLWLMSLLLLGVSLSASAIVTAPTLEAADQLGQEVVGEILFKPHSNEISLHAQAEILRELQAICPDGPLEANQMSLFLFAWSDREFPPLGSRMRTSQDLRLANARLESVESLLRPHLPADVALTSVNMAMRSAQRVHVAKFNSDPDMRQVLEESGAAPVDDFESGLFGEYAQRGKALVLAHCDPNAAIRHSLRSREIRIATKMPREE